MLISLNGYSLGSLNSSVSSKLTAMTPNSWNANSNLKKKIREASESTSRMFHIGIFLAHFSKENALYSPRGRNEYKGRSLGLQMCYSLSEKEICMQKRKDKYAEKRWGLQNCNFKASRGRAIDQQTHTFPFGDPGIPRPKVHPIFCPNFPFFPDS